MSYYQEYSEEIKQKKRQRYLLKTKDRLRKTSKWSNTFSVSTDGSHSIMSIMKKPPVGDRIVVASVLFDSDDLEMIRRHHWKLDPHGYPCCFDFYTEEDEDSRFCFLHRYVMNAGNKDFVKNISGDHFNCRKQNLSVCDSIKCVMHDTKNTDINGVYTESDRSQQRYYITVRLDGEHYTIWEGDSKEERDSFCALFRGYYWQQLRDQHYKHLISEQPHKYISRQKTQRGWKISFKRQYIGWELSLSDAIKRRDKHVHDYVWNIWKNAKVLGNQTINKP